MNKPLPADREKALAAIAAGWGREATTAHPLCTCTTSCHIDGHGQWLLVGNGLCRRCRDGCRMHGTDNRDAS